MKEQWETGYSHGLTIWYHIRKEQDDFLGEKSGWYHLSPVTSDQSDQQWDTFISGTLEAEKSTKSLFCCFYKKVENLNLNMRKHQIHPNGDQIFYKTTDSVQFSSVAQSCPTLCDPMNRSTPGLPGHHQLPEFTQTHVHWVNDAIQPSHPLSSHSLPAPNPSQHQSLFQWVNSSDQVAKILEFQL